MLTLGIEFTGNDLYNQTTKQSNLQGKYVDVDRVKSKTLQSELPHRLYATKKGALVWRRCGGLRVFFHEKHRYCGWFFFILRYCGPRFFLFWLEFSRNIKYPCQFFVGRVLFQRKKRLMDDRNLFGWGAKEVGIWCKVAAAWFDIMIYSGCGSNIQQGYILKLHPESKCAWKSLHRLCRVRRCCKYRIL